MKRGRVQKKALSPVITTILLILIAIILAIIILLWARGFIKEGVQKFGGPIEDACSDVKFDSSVSGPNSLSVINSGDVTIYKFGVEISGVSSDIVYSETLNLAPGSSKVFDLSESIEGYKLKVIPVLLGQLSDSSVHEYNCRSQIQVLNS